MIWEEYWDPFEYAERVKRRIDRMIRKILREEFFPEGFEMPKTDVLDEGEEIVVRVDLPGVKKEDIDLRVFPNRIEVRARSRRDVEVQRGNFYRRERSYVGYQRIIPLPVQVDPETAKARYQDGVLEVRIRKKEAGGRKVEIE